MVLGQEIKMPPHELFVYQCGGCGFGCADFGTWCEHHYRTNHWLAGGPQVHYVNLGGGEVGIEIDGIPFEKLK